MIYQKLQQQLEAVGELIVTLLEASVPGLQVSLFFSGCTVTQGRGVPQIAKQPKATSNVPKLHMNYHIVHNAEGFHKNRILNF